MSESELKFLREIDLPEDLTNAFEIEQRMKKEPHVVICTVDFDGIKLTDFIKFLLGKTSVVLSDELYSCILNTYTCGVRRSRDKATMLMRPEELRKDLAKFRDSKVFWYDW